MIARGCIRRNARQLTTSTEQAKLFKIVTFLRSTNRSYSIEPKSKKGDIFLFKTAFVKKRLLIQAYQDTKKKRVVILGSGWAGYSFARTLDPAKYERVVISPRSYFVFTPLLASTSVGTLEFRAILEPVRRAPGGLRFYQGWADDVDFSRKVIRVEANAIDKLQHDLSPISASTAASEVATETRPPRGEIFDVEYDKLVIAVGAYSQTFGIAGVREHAHFLRDIGDARRIRLRVLSIFEQCSYPTSPGGKDGKTAGKPLTEEEKKSLLHFVIVGGGPTGIEFAAELHDLIHEDLKRIYPELMPLVRITVYDVAPKVLPMFDKALAQYAMEVFARQGIQVRTEHHLEGIRAADGTLGSAHGGLSIKIKEYGDKEVEAGLVVWSTGLMQNPFVEQMVKKQFTAVNEADASKNHLLKDPRTGGIVTDGYLRARITDNEASNSDETAPTATPVLPDVFVIGDCAVVEGNESLPKTAQVASQQAAHLARQLNRSTDESIDIKSAWKPFKFRNWGTLTYLGGWKAIHQSSADTLRGWVAWIVWRGAYLTRSMSVRNKLMVPVYWFVNWVFGRDISRF